MTNRIAETWHRLREWTDSSATSERLAAQILHHEAFKSIDPSHPLGGKDDGQDARCVYANESWSMAVYFPRGEKSFREIKAKFLSDVAKVKRSDAAGIAFVINQELRLSERGDLENLASPLKVELFHLERVAGILDRPEMESVRRQFLLIETNPGPTINNLGGKGGNALGAGGGGGGATGRALGGDGGKGGDIYSFAGTPGKFPGAGGGGAGAFGPGSQGGEGGQGGEYVTGIFEVTPGMSIPIKIGKGGAPRPGRRDGGDGGDTSFGDIVAKGGKGGKAGFNVIVSREASQADRDAGLHISTLMLAECFHFRNGLADVLAAGIEHVSFVEFPGKLSLVLFGTLSVGSAPVGVEYEFVASLEASSGKTVWSQPFKIFSGMPRRIARPCFALLIDCEVEQPGVWTVSIHSAGHSFGRLPIEALVSPN